MVSARVVYRSRAKPQNSEPAEFSMTRSRSPETTHDPRPSWLAVAVRTSRPERQKEWPPSRSHGYCSTVTRANEIACCDATKCLASSSAKSSIWPTPCSLANANTVFFCASVVSTAELSPVTWVAARSPDSATLTFRSAISCVSPSRPAPSRLTCRRRTSAFPYWLAPSTMAMAQLPR